MHPQTDRKQPGSHERSRAVDDAGAPADERHGQVARHARAIMEANVSTPMTISQLAQACSTSPTVLKESFRAFFGVPVYRYYRAMRIERAKDLLDTGSRSIAEIASAVGYANPSKFSAAFRGCIGVTPSAWQKQARDQRAQANS